MGEAAWGGLVLALLIAACHADEARFDIVSLSADQMLDICVASMPQAPLSINGELIVRKQRGVEIRRVGLHVNLRWGDSPQQATYTLHHQDDGIIETLHLTRDNTNGTPSITYTRDGITHPLPAQEALAGTDIGWADLAFDFLWWRNAKKIGDDSFKGRACTILEIPQPTALPGPYATVRVWMDNAMMAMVKAEGYDPQGDMLRSLWVSGLKEVDDRWMISEMEVQQRPFIHRTKVRIEEVTEAQP
jgi:hypothetical protein